jgi:hypothetical protein
VAKIVQNGKTSLRRLKLSKEKVKHLMKKNKIENNTEKHATVLLTEACDT